MSKQISASDAKNNFGGLLEDVAAVGRVEILKHGRLIAVVFSPRALKLALAEGVAGEQLGLWGEKHMIPPDRARAARMRKAPNDFDEG
jgi:prevent-host-death family protein